MKGFLAMNEPTQSLSANLRDGEVWVAGECRRSDQTAHWRRRLRDGMGHDLDLVPSIVIPDPL